MNNKTKIAIIVVAGLFSISLLLAVQCERLMSTITALQAREDNFISKKEYNQLVGAVNTNAMFCSDVAKGLHELRNNQEAMNNDTIPAIQYQVQQMEALTNLYVKFGEFEQREAAIKQAQDDLRQLLDQKNTILGKEALKLEALEAAIIKLSGALQSISKPTVQTLPPVTPQIAPQQPDPSVQNLTPNPETQSNIQIK